MSGYVWRDDAERGHSTGLPQWEAMATDAVGHVIEFWGFKRNQGRVWALLYLRSVPMSAQELMDELALSKGAVSMLTRELEQWGVIRRVRETGQGVWRFVAGTDLMQMVGRVIREREAGMIARIREDLQNAEDLARASKEVKSEELERIKRMRTLAQMVEKALHLFLSTARLDINTAFDALQGDDPAS